MTEKWNYPREVKEISRKMSKKRQNGLSEKKFDGVQNRSAIIAGWEDEAGY